MKKIFSIALAVCMAFSITACSSIPKPTSVSEIANQPIGDYTILDEKSWFYAESLYNVPAYAYLSANKRGLFATQPALKATLKKSLQALNKGRNEVYLAYKAGNAAAFADKIKALKALSDSVSPLIPR
jgi:hypothetical protein